MLQNVIIILFVLFQAFSAVNCSAIVCLRLYCKGFNVIWTIIIITSHNIQVYKVVNFTESILIDTYTFFLRLIIKAQIFQYGA